MMHGQRNIKLLLPPFLALYQLCRRSLCCASISLLCHVMITVTLVSTGTNCQDVASAERNYAAIMLQVLVGLLHL